MGKNSNIEWTHHTFNPWWGCTKVSPACLNCYAESWSRRMGQEVWGVNSPRRFFSGNHWDEPLKWNKLAETTGEKRRVFCASMGDVFEDKKELNDWREKLWGIIEKTKYLDWLLLTKRPELIEIFSPWKFVWPENIWLGTTVENQKYAEIRIPHLIKHPAKVRFISCEPLLEGINLRKWLKTKQNKESINWVIAGGESGVKARPMNPDWVENLRDQCVKTKVPFHFKQWGHWKPVDNSKENYKKSIILNSENGKKVKMIPVGKKVSGRELDGEIWDHFPKPF